MGDLDKKLTNLIESYHGDTNKLILNIKQTFRDNGYVRTVIMNSHTVAMNGKDPLGWILYYPNEAMTGQEWYDRFEAELDAGLPLPTVVDIWVRKSAKRAAGLTE